MGSPGAPLSVETAIVSVPPYCGPPEVFEVDVVEVEDVVDVDDVVEVVELDEVDLVVVEPGSVA